MASTPRGAEPGLRLSAPFLLLRAAAFTAAYTLCGIIGVSLNTPPSGFSVIWPATAVVIASLMLTPVRHWWIYLPGLVLAHLVLIRAVQPVPTLVALSYVAGNFATPAAIALIMRRIGLATSRFDSVGDVLVFTALAGGFVPAFVSALILLIHMQIGWVDDFWLSLRQWLLATAFPTITVTPLLLLALQRRVLAGEPLIARIELGALCAVLFSVSMMVFGVDADMDHWPTLLLTPFPFLLWAAMRWGVGGACLTLLCFAGAIIAHARGGDGPFAIGATAISVVSLQVFLTTAAILILVVAALIEERRENRDLIRRSEERIEITAAATDTGLWQWDAVGRRLWTTAHCRAMLGLDEAAAKSPEAFLDAIHPDDRARVSAGLTAALASAHVDALSEFRLLRGGKDVRWFVMRTKAEIERGEVIRVNGVFRDVTSWMVARRHTEQLSSRLLSLQESERRMIADELHDATSQHLTAVGLTVRALRLKLNPKPEIARLFDDIQSSLAATSKELRTFSFLLRPPELMRLGLSTVLKRYADGFERRTDVSASVHVDERADDLPIEHQRTVLRIVQESLANVHRHAGASQVAIRLRLGEDALHLVIADDGCGFGETVQPLSEDELPLGVGLQGMAARARQLGGDVRLRNRGSGALVHVVLPVGPEEGAPGRGEASAISA